MNRPPRLEISQREIMVQVLKNVHYWPAEPAQFERRQVVDSIRAALPRLDDRSLIAVMWVANALAYT